MQLFASTGRWLPHSVRQRRHIRTFHSVGSTLGTLADDLAGIEWKDYEEDVQLSDSTRVLSVTTAPWRVLAECRAARTRPQSYPHIPPEQESPC